MNGTYIQGRYWAKRWIREGKEDVIEHMLHDDPLHLCNIFGSNWVNGFLDVVA